MKIDLPIDPASLPTAQQKGVTRTGRVYTKAKVAKAKARLVTELQRRVLTARAVTHDNLFGLGPLDATRTMTLSWSVAIEFVYALKATPKRMDGHPKLTRPDLDNLTKLVLDAMTACNCFFIDDAQVATLTTLKRHARRAPTPEPAHITIFVRPLFDNELALFDYDWRTANEKRDYAYRGDVAD